MAYLGCLSDLTVACGRHNSKLVMRLGQRFESAPRWLLAVGSVRLHDVRVLLEHVANRVVL